MASKEAEKYKLKGNEEFKKGNHAKAIEFYTYATELDPNSPIYYTNRSNAYYLMKNFEKSLRDAKKAIKADAKWEKGHYRAGMALMAVEKYQEALDCFKTACDLAPANKTFQNEMARAKASMMKGMSQAEIIKQEGNEAFKAGKIEPAVEIYTRAIAVCKSDEKDMAVKASCLCNRAACYRQLYHPEDCIKDCTEVLDMIKQGENSYAPNTIVPLSLAVKALIRRAQAFESMEKYKKAIADFECAARFDPNARIAYQGATRLKSVLNQYGSGKN